MVWIVIIGLMVLCLLVAKKKIIKIIISFVWFLLWFTMFFLLIYDREKRNFEISQSMGEDPSIWDFTFGVSVMSFICALLPFLIVLAAYFAIKFLFFATKLLFED